MTDNKPLYRHLCEGGPWTGRFAESRSAQGFWLVDKSNDRATPYTYDEASGTWRAGGAEGWSQVKRRGADDGRLDVRVVEDADQ